MHSLLQWKNNTYCVFWVCVCSVRYPACNAHVPQYIGFRGLSDSITIFPTLSNKYHEFRKKKLLKIKCVFWFSLKLLSEIFFILRRIERNITNYVGYVFKSISRYSYGILRKRKLTQQIFKKLSNFTEIHPVGGELFHAVGRTERHDEVNPLNAKLNVICPLLALFGTHHIFHLSR